VDTNGDGTATTPPVPVSGGGGSGIVIVIVIVVLVCGTIGATGYMHKLHSRKFSPRCRDRLPRYKNLDKSPGPASA
jgi:hypothetical protein